VFSALARLKFLRATPFNPFGYTLERRTERALIREYEATIDEVLARLDARNHAVAVELAWLPEHIRGYGHVKAASVEAARQERASCWRGCAASRKPASFRFIHARLTGC